jgi:hypothetical protein
MFVEIVNTEGAELWEGDLEKIPNIGDLFVLQYPKPDYYEFGYDDSTILMVCEVLWNIGDDHRVMLTLTDDWEYEEEDEDDEEDEDEDDDDEDECEEEEECEEQDDEEVDGIEEEDKETEEEVEY